jgi:hypothetical protein
VLMVLCDKVIERIFFRILAALITVGRHELKLPSKRGALGRVFREYVPINYHVEEVRFARILTPNDAYFIFKGEERSYLVLQLLV